MPVIMNFLLALCVVGAVLAHGRKTPMNVILRFFTAQSNIFCAAAAAAVACFRLFGAVPEAVLVLKYVGTAAVTVTMLTVVFFLGPTIGYRVLFTGPDLWLHLICPVLAIVSCLLWDKPGAGPWIIGLGMLPVVLYGILYLYKVVYVHQWDDFYGFNRGGKWPVSFAAMVIGSFLISLALWMIRF